MLEKARERHFLQREREIANRITISCGYAGAISPQLRGAFISFSHRDGSCSRIVLCLVDLEEAYAVGDKVSQEKYLHVMNVPRRGRLRLPSASSVPFGYVTEAKMPICLSRTG